MDNYIVSARKYRPTTFESVVGQHALTTTLKNAITTGKLAHAYLFCGPRGVGKTTCARIFAKTINCMNLTPEGEACNECESCVAFNEHRSYNIYELDAASNNSVDDIRQLVEQVRIPPQIGKYKVYIIDEVHMLSGPAFNAFLKTLEEPPHHTIFILATTEKYKIIPTILSRCQIYDFNRIGVEDIVAHLARIAAREQIVSEPEALNVIALKADGGMRDALSIFDQVVSFTGGHITYKSVIENLNVLDYEYYFRLTDQMLNNQVSEALLLLNEVINKGFDAGHFITGLASHFRDLLVSKDSATLPLLEVGASIRRQYGTQAQQCPQKFLYRAIKLCNDADLNYRLSKNKRLLVELTLIQIAQLTDETGDVEGGRSPKQAIKPIFNTPQTPQASQAQAQPMQSVRQPDTPTPTVAPAATRPTTPHQPPTDVLEALRREEKKPPVMTMPKLSISIKQTHTAGEATATQQAVAAPLPSAQETAQEFRPFGQNELNDAWLSFAATLPHEQIALAKRMQVLRPAMLDEVTFEIVLDNDIAVKEFTELIPTLQDYIRPQLRNARATMRVRLSEPEENKRPVSKVEKYQMMVEKNEALAELKETFGLELY
ncbi:MAG: DNA polymerase III subunit gamma/tau [Mediterranea sp.]|jgi:DNA polymerase-3 subunit gamma/tau|nr:DNA polymerase III subunit gamma/tau [Mediterranea sp.]